MCYWVIYIEEKQEGDKLNFTARPFSNLEKLYDWVSKTEHVVAISITQSIYNDIIKESTLD